MPKMKILFPLVYFQVYGDKSHLATTLRTVCLSLITEHGFFLLCVNRSRRNSFPPQLLRLTPGTVGHFEGIASHHGQIAQRRRGERDDQRLEIRRHGRRQDLFDHVHLVHHRGHDRCPLLGATHHRAVKWTNMEISGSVRQDSAKNPHRWIFNVQRYILLFLRRHLFWK